MPVLPVSLPDPGWDKHKENVDIWLEEVIWGHRFYDQPTPMLALLEMLNVAASVQREGKEPFEHEPERASYRKSLFLRTVIFANESLNDPVARDLDSDGHWRKHQEQLARSWQEMRNRGKSDIFAVELCEAENLDFLPGRFCDKSFSNYQGLVRLLQENALEFESNKRWTSQFLFPYCEEALFEDLNDKTFSSDRRFFGRTGEMAYLMLCRSGQGKQIWNSLNKICFDSSQPHVMRWGNAVKALVYDGEASAPTLQQAGKKVGYLPDHHSQLFSIFGEDVKMLLDAGMPEYDAVPYLADLISFHLIHYVMSVAADNDPAGDVKYVCEIHNRRNDMVRRLSQESYRRNRERTERRLRRELDALRKQVEKEDAWSSGDLLKWLENRFVKDLSNPDIKKRTLDVNFNMTPEDIWEELEKAVLKKHKAHLGKFHHSFARLCGLGSRSGTREYRYSPSDDFMRLLVLTNVEKRLEYDAFIERLHNRYGIVISKRHAAMVYKGKDLSSFDQNEERLRVRLQNLGLLRSLSDDCAYVINRFTEEKR